MQQLKKFSIEWNPLYTGGYWYSRAKHKNVGVTVVTNVI